MKKQRYLVALGSNQRHPQFGNPREVVAATMELIDETLGKVVARSPIIDSRPVGPSQRTYANAALVLKTKLDPPGLLDCLQVTEAALGRRRLGQRWRSRVIDLDIVWWSGGCWGSPDLVVPHLLFRERAFVLGPAAAVAPNWRDPVSGLTTRQLLARLTGMRPVPR